MIANNSGIMKILTILSDLPTWIILNHTIGCINLVKW